MNKKITPELVLFVCLVFVAVSFFKWMHQALGTTGLLALFFSLPIFYLGSKIFINKRNNARFDKLVCAMIDREFSTQEISEIYKRISKSDISRGVLVRRLQILLESADIALESKKRDTAESRLNVALNCFDEISAENSKAISSQALAKIAGFVSSMEDSYNTESYLNSALASLDKAEKLKTKKAKLKNINLAKETLIEASYNERSDKERVGNLLSKVLKLESEIESSL